MTCSVLFVVESNMDSYGGTERWINDFARVNHGSFKNCGIVKLKSEINKNDSLIRNFETDLGMKFFEFCDVNKKMISKKLRKLFGEKIYQYFIYQILICVYNFKSRKELKRYEVAYITSYAMIVPIKLLNPKIKIVYGTHNNDFSTLRGKGVFSPGKIHARLSLILVNLIHFITAQDGDFPTRNTESITVENGVDIRKFFLEKKMKSSNIMEVLYVGRLEEYKGIKIALDAFKLLPEDRYHFTVCGDGSLKKYVQDNMPKNSKLVSNADDLSLQAIYRRSDILVFPSLTETFGLVVLEALASGVFCVISEQLKPKFEEFLKFGMIAYCERSGASFANMIISQENNLPDDEAIMNSFRFISERYSIYSRYPILAERINKMCSV